MTVQRDDNAKCILTQSQLELAPLLNIFSSTHLLVGGTAIALHLCHRQSIDFDLFCFGPQGTGKELMSRISASGCSFDLVTAPPFWHSDEEQPELTLFFNGVKVQWIDFSRNPFGVPVYLGRETEVCGMPSLDLMTLGALKVYAMMYRTKRKDAVDVAMILQAGISLHQLVTRAQQIFGMLYKPEYTMQTIIQCERDETEEVQWLSDAPPSHAFIHEMLTQGVQDDLQQR